MNAHGFILPARIIGVLILLTALVPAAIGVWFYTWTSDFLGEAVATEGEVVEVKASQGSEGTSYTSVFEYEDASGEVHRKPASFSSNPPSHSVGERVEVLYRESEPSEARINSFMSLWFGPVICAAMAVFPLVFSLVFIWLIPFTIRRVWPQEPQAEIQTRSAEGA